MLKDNQLIKQRATAGHRQNVSSSLTVSGLLLEENKSLFIEDQALDNPYTDNLE